MSQRCLIYGWENGPKPYSLYFPTHWNSTNLPLLIYLTAEEAILQCGYELVCRSKCEDSVLRRCIDRALVFRTGVSVNVMAAGKHMLVFATQDGMVWTIGLNTIKPKRKDEKNITQEPLITSIATGTHISKMAVGDFHCLLVASMTGQLFAFGRGSFGELGNGDRFEWVHDPTPVIMPQDETVVSVSAGACYSAVVGSSGSVYTFGSGAYFRLGIGTDEDCIIPTRVFSFDSVGGGHYDGRGFSGVSYCCCGTWHTVALARDSRDVFAWGWSKFGQAGGPQEEVIVQPRRVPGLREILDRDEIQSISCGSRHTALLTTSGRVILL